MKRGVFQPNKTRNITGLRFNNLVAVRFDHRDERVTGGQHYWLFRCDCGNEIILRKNSVTSNNTTCCPECSRRRRAEQNTKHGGVSVCDEWRDFTVFRDWAVANGYDDTLTIDRIDASGNYEPSNCRWASVREQANNKKKTIYIEYDGETLPLSYWAERFSIQYHTLYDRIYRYGWGVKKAFTTQVRRSK